MLVPHTPHGPGMSTQAQFGQGPMGAAGRAAAPWIKGGLLVASLAIPGGVILKISKVGKISRVLRTAGEIRRPMHTTLAFVYPKSRLLSSTLAVRKGLGAAALGYNLLHPFETIRHIQKGDLDKAAINLMYPIVGVPIYESLVEGSSSKTYQQNGGLSAPPPLVVTDDWRESLSDPVDKSQGKPTRKLRGRSRPRCPPGHRWNGSRCVRIRS